MSRPRQETAPDDDKVDNDDHVDELPLHRQRPFGSGIRMDPIKFVPASSTLQSVDEPPAAPSAAAGQSAADAYLAIVMAKSRARPAAETRGGGDGAGPGPGIFCDACQRPAGATEADRRGHEASLAHQLGLAHSHPPSALDRSRMGLAYLRSYGWDPDSRRGLGADAQGIVYPLKGVVREDKAGLGADANKKPAATATAAGSRKDGQTEPPRPRLLDAAKVRKKADDDRKKSERLRQQLYGNVDIEKYLGPGA